VTTLVDMPKNGGFPRFIEKLNKYPQHLIVL